MADSVRRGQFLLRKVPVGEGEGMGTSGFLE